VRQAAGFAAQAARRGHFKKQAISKSAGQGAATKTVLLHGEELQCSHALFEGL
jgi:hypothetical protein